MGGTSDPLVLSDTLLVVANGGTRELRFYNWHGEFLRTAGGDGDGPGEFRNITSIDRFRGDSLLAFDSRNLRASVFDCDGRFARSFSIGQVTNSAYPGLVGALSNGLVVIRENHPYIAGRAPTGADRSPAALVLTDPGGGARDTLGIFPGDETFVMAVPSDMWITVRPVTFGRGLVTAVADDKIAVAMTDSFTVRVFGSNGSLREIVRQRRTPVPVRSMDINRFNDSLLATQVEERSRKHYREMFDLMPTPEVFPALASIRYDRLGNLWVEEYERLESRVAAWQVFDKRGILSAKVQIPSGLRVLDIGADYVLGLLRDEMGVEKVALYQLDKSQS